MLRHLFASHSILLQDLYSSLLTINEVMERAGQRYCEQPLQWQLGLTLSFGSICQCGHHHLWCLFPNHDASKTCHNTNQNVGAGLGLLWMKINNTTWKKTTQQPTLSMGNDSIENATTFSLPWGVNINLSVPIVHKPPSNLLSTISFQMIN